MSINFVRALLPAMVFQSVIIAGGFATGVEASQYGLSTGSDYLFFVLFVMSSFVILYYLSSTIVLDNQVYDYNSWAKQFLGRATPMFDLLFITMSILVIAICISAFTDVLNKNMGVSLIIGSIMAIILTSGISILGRNSVIAVKVIGSIVLTLTYVIVFIKSFNCEGETVLQISQKHDWVINGFEYVCYNSVALPASLYSLILVRKRSDIRISAFMAGVLVIMPFILISYTLLNTGVDYLNTSTPLLDALIVINNNNIKLMYVVVLLWTLLDTAIGLVYAVLQRIEVSYINKTKAKLGFLKKVVFVTLFVLLTYLLSKYGIVDLVVKGYGMMAYLFFLIMIAPMLFYLYKKRSKQGS